MNDKEPITYFERGILDAVADELEGRGETGRAFHLRAIAKRAVTPSDAAGAPIWRPIETVPKDGTEVALLFASEVEILGQTCPRVRAASWRIDWTIPYRRDNPPTHWSPLPIAPNDAPVAPAAGALSSEALANPDFSRRTGRTSVQGSFIPLSLKTEPRAVKPGFFRFRKRSFASFRFRIEDRRGNQNRSREVP